MSAHEFLLTVPLPWRALLEEEASIRIQEHRGLENYPVAKTSRLPGLSQPGDAAVENDYE